jgi:very-short-patch-repair endonuclease
VQPVSLWDTQRTHPVAVVGASDVLVVSGPPGQRVAAIAEAQRGRVSAAQLLAAGLTRGMIRTMRHRGQLREEHRGVYAVGHRTEITWAAETSALLAVDRGAAISHRSAAALWGLLTHEPDAPVDVTLLDGRQARSRAGVRVHRSRTLTARDVRVENGLNVTTPTRALLELADDCTQRELELALDEALTRKLVTRAAIQKVLRRAGKGRRGAPALTALTNARGPSSITRSMGEERLRELIIAARIPLPDMQDPLHGFEADFHWREARYVVEFDGHQFHSTLSAFRRDRLKGRTFARHGIRLDRFTWDDVTKHQLATAAHIAATLAERTAPQKLRTH